MREPSRDPAGLLRWLAALPEHKGTCIECGAGSGELSAFLNPLFDRVLATDASPPPTRQQHVPVMASGAETLLADSQSVDLVFSMQALHHFDVAAHLSEARRVIRPGGVFAAFCWGPILLPTEIARAYQPLFEVLEPYWEDGRAWVVSGYEGLSFDGASIEMPRACMTREMTLNALEAEMATWTAVQNALARGVAFPDPEGDLPGEDEVFDANWQILGQVFRV